jgi:peptide subunit release factor 1 (eRF1)
MQRVRFFTVDLTKEKGRGEFKCPKCQVEISPDDETETSFTILEPVMKGNCLEKIVIQCNKCGAQIQLIGFGNLNKIK